MLRWDREYLKLIRFGSASECNIALRYCVRMRCAGDVVATYDDLV